MPENPQVQIAILQTEVKNLTQQVADLTKSVKELTAVMNRGKGAFAASLALSGVVGAGIMQAVQYLFNGSHPRPDAMNDRDINHLHPDLQPLCRKWLALCHQQAVNSIVTYTWRSVAEQNSLYAQGRTVPGKVVTNAKGGQSLHNFTCVPDGSPAAKAFDFAIQRMDGTLNWDVNSSEWRAAVAIGKDLGLVWGGDFRSIKDYDHFQLRDDA